MSTTNPAMIFQIFNLQYPFRNNNLPDIFHSSVPGISTRARLKKFLRYWWQRSHQ